MKTGFVAALFLFLTLVVSQAGDANWAGHYDAKKLLNGKAVFQLTIIQEGDKISVDFDAAYNDGEGCAPEGNGPAKVVDKNTLQFTFTDSSNNSGTGTIKRAPDGVIISVKPLQVADSRCVVFYSDNLRLRRAR